MLELPTPFHGGAGRPLDLALDSFLGLFHEGADVASPDVRLHEDPALAPVTLDGRWSRALLDPHELGERQPLPGRGGDQDLFQSSRVLAISRRQPDYQREASS